MYLQSIENQVNVFLLSETEFFLKILNLDIQFVKSQSLFFKKDWWYIEQVGPMRLVFGGIRREFRQGDVDVGSDGEVRRSPRVHEVG